MSCCASHLPTPCPGSAICSNIVCFPPNIVPTTFSLIRHCFHHIFLLSRTDINEIFKDIATMVQEQGNMIDSIESNLTVASDRVEDGTTQLTHASRYQVSPRRSCGGVGKVKADNFCFVARCRRFYHIVLASSTYCLAFSPLPSSSCSGGVIAPVEKSAQQSLLPSRHCRHCGRYPGHCASYVAEEEEQVDPQRIFARGATDEEVIKSSVVSSVFLRGASC